MSLKDKIRASTAAKGGKSTGSVARARRGGRADFRELAKKLVDLLGEDDLQGAIKVWRDGLTANVFAWSAKEAAMVDTGHPDWPVREKMAAQIVAYMEGRPVERSIQLTGKFTDLGAELAQLRGSPEAMRALASITPGAIPIEAVQETGGENGPAVSEGTSE